ncbi:MAG: flagellar assembly protein FliH [Hydrogenophilales bacterium]|nr:flagellar assembly protein FliH [Hydrogenophilales bacterium]
MSSKSIPKEQLSAYQRWELSAFDQPSRVKLPTADEIQRIQQQAYQEGFAAGMKDGRAEGQSVAQQMQALMAELHQSMQQFEITMAQEIMDLALDIARQMVRSALAVNPELVLAVVREAIESLPQTNQNPTLILHPEDALLVRDMLAHEYQESVWRVVDDPLMQRGGCRVETGATEIDANMESRWQRIVAALGSDAAWRK